MMDNLVISAVEESIHATGYPKDVGAVLLVNDAKWSQEAKNFSSKVRDLAEFLAEIPMNSNLGEVKMTLTYQDPCHLAHG